MYSVGRDGLDIPGLMNDPRSPFLRPWGHHERRKTLFDLKIPSALTFKRETNVPQLTDKDVLYFVFGEIDARWKIPESMNGQNKKNLFEEVNGIVDRYLVAIQKAVSVVPAKTVWMGGLHPPGKQTENINGWSPMSGTFETRWITTLLINRRLKQFCVKHGYFFNDLTEGYATPEGDLDMTMTDGNHHLNFWTEDTKNSIAEQLQSHRLKVCNI